MSDIKQPALAISAVAVAHKFVGVTEKPLGSNKGPEVKLFLNSIGLDEGHSWCMAFVYYCWKIAAAESARTNPLVKTGGVLKHYNVVRADGRALITNTPQVGDIFIMDHGGGLGHTGLVTAVEDDSVRTVEGNSDAAGSRTGGSVCKNKRKIKTIKAFIRYA